MFGIQIIPKDGIESLNNIRNNSNPTFFGLFWQKMAPWQLADFGQGYSWKFGRKIREAVFRTQNPNDLNELKNEIAIQFAPIDPKRKFSISILEVWLRQDTPGWVGNLNLDGHITEANRPLEAVVNFYMGQNDLCCYIKVFRMSYLRDAHNHLSNGGGQGDTAM